MLTTCDDDLLSLETRAILMKSSSDQCAFTICGEQLIRIARFWIFWSKANEIREPLRSTSANYKSDCDPRVMITVRLRSYGAAKAEVLPGVEHPQQQYQNNHGKFTSADQIGRAGDEAFQVIGPHPTFLSAFGITNSHFRVGDISVPLAAIEKC